MFNFFNRKPKNRAALASNIVCSIVIGDPLSLKMIEEIYDDDYLVILVNKELSPYCKRIRATRRGIIIERCDEIC